MNFVVNPGQKVQLMTSPKDRPQELSALLTTVVTVRSGMFSVAEADSINGLAKVTCHGASKETGTYWYEYTDLEGEPVSHDTTIYLEGGSQRVRANGFIIKS